ncbi:alpha/beta hydrolase [Cyclobacterium sp. 1_MG-2023]|uniref:alpha/beta fold hydrolase n=1 Tax=Cyclobacterium sp. 1_MG-2023 TaxID=3062681 RepID=UPI0026E1FC16|nr:alpha/beta hydrolase [Cyclobacterium sp. 1_MG-2023]MDO6437776.1 alpha/beta hydrolase [Cyclobacterium sp. 1_MG-2023]
MPFIKTNGINLYYEEHGEGDPLLLIMGITAPGAVWEKHLNYWKQFFRCIIVDNRGVGQSDKPAGPYTSSQMADDCAGLLQHLELKNVRVAGVSMGSIIAQELAFRHPVLVKSMVLMCPWARCDNTAKDIFKHMVDIKARLKPEEFSRYIQLLIFSKASFDNKETYQGMLDDRENAKNDSNPQPLIGLEGQAEACMEHHILEQLNEIKQPVLVIGGEADKFTPLWMTKEVAEALPNSDLHTYPESGHAFHWENLEDFNPRVKQWLLAH